jgi:DNA-binding LacI/PurR family transcriptional regulator
VSSSAPTIKDIAARAGVSISTVHYALRRTRPISEETRERVLAAIRELDYQPHAGAASLPSGRTRRIALVIAGIEPAFANTYFSDFIRGLAAAAEAEEHAVVLVTAYGRRAAEGWRPIHLLRRREADAIVLAGTQFAAEHLDELADAQAPCVLLNQEHPGLLTVTADRAQGASLAAAHLLGLGRWPLGLIAARFPGSGPPATRPELRGFSAALAGAGLSPDDAHVAFVSVRGGEAEVRTQVQRFVDEAKHERPGLVVFSYTLAAAAARAVAAAHVQVPDDLALVFDEDDTYLDALELAPTVVQAAKFEMAQAALRVLLKMLRGERLPEHERHQRYPMTLRVRQTSGVATRGACAIGLRERSTA